jgi:hypothetical protein
MKRHIKAKARRILQPLLDGHVWTLIDKHTQTWECTKCEGRIYCPQRPNPTVHAFYKKLSLIPSRMGCEETIIAKIMDS